MKSLFLLCLIFTSNFYSLHAQSSLNPPFTESFTTGLNNWKTNSTISVKDWKWYHNVGVGGSGGLRMEQPADSNYIVSPAIVLQAGKTYTVSFKARVDRWASTRLVSVGFNQVRSLKNNTTFYTQYLPTDQYAEPPFKEYNPTFSVPSTGNYYLTFYYSENGSSYAYLDEITVEETQYPSIFITSPTDGESMNENYTDSTKVWVSASAFDADGSIAKVELFANGIKLTEKTAPPYQFLWKDVLPKNYVFTAKATDNRGNVTNSLPLNYTVNFRDGTLNKYVHWDFNSTNTIGKGLDYWTTSGGEWGLIGGGFHGTDMLHDFSAYANNFAASPGVYLQAGQIYQLEFISHSASGNKIMKLFLNKKQALNDSIPIDTVLIKAENLSIIHKKNITVSQSGTYHLIIHYPTPSSYIKVRMDNIRIIGNNLNIAPLSKITAPFADITVAENASMTLKSEVVDVDGSVQKVEYFANETKVAESMIPPNYETRWLNIPRGNYKLTARPIDNLNAQANSLKTTVMADTNRFSASSLIGGTGEDDIRSIIFQKNGTIIIAANMGNIAHLNSKTIFLNNATTDSTGVIIRLASDGKSILSMTRLCTKVSDLSKDNNDNLYIAAWKSGIFKLNPTADTLIWKRRFSKTVHRIDAGFSGKNICMTASETDINDGTLTGTSNYLHDENGNLMYQFGETSQYGADVAIDEASQSVIMVGFKNFRTYDSKGGTQFLPVFVPVVRGFSYLGTQKYVGYDWSSDTSSTRWINRSDNNMADARLNRCAIGKDGKLYLAGQVYGGNHCFRYSPFDIMQRSIFAAGVDDYFSLSNTNTESHVYVGRYDPATGQELLGQTFTARLPSALRKGNSVFIDQGGLDADSSGRVYISGISAYGLPLTTDYIPGEYTGGAYVLVLSPNMEVREVCARLAFGMGRTVATFNKKRWIYGGYTDNSNLIYLVNPFQITNLSTSTNKWNGWFALSNNLKCPTTNTHISSIIPSGTTGMSGRWNVPSTWECGTIPRATNQVTIEAGHTVIIPSGYTGKAQSLELKGILKKEIGSGFEIIR